MGVKALGVGAELGAAGRVDLPVDVGSGGESGVADGEELLTFTDGEGLTGDGDAGVAAVGHGLDVVGRHTGPEGGAPEVGEDVVVAGAGVLDGEDAAVGVVEVGARGKGKDLGLVP